MKDGTFLLHYLGRSYYWDAEFKKRMEEAEKEAHVPDSAIEFYCRWLRVWADKTLEIDEQVRNHIFYCQTCFVRATNYMKQHSPARTCLMSWSCESSTSTCWECKDLDSYSKRGDSDFTESRRAEPIQGTHIFTLKKRAFIGKHAWFENQRTCSRDVVDEFTHNENYWCDIWDPD